MAMHVGRDRNNLKVKKKFLQVAHLINLKCDVPVTQKIILNGCPLLATTPILCKGYVKASVANSFRTATYVSYYRPHRLPR